MNKNRDNRREENFTKESGKDQLMNNGIALPEPLPGILTKQRFSELANYKNECCISIYLEKPTQPNDNMLGFKKHLVEMRQILKQREMSEKDINSLLYTAESLLKSGDFWTKHQSHQLAFFISSELFYYIQFSEPVVVDRVFEKSFYVTPLLQLVKQENYFYVNVVSKKGCRLFKADMKGIQPVPIIIPDQADTKSSPDKEDSFRTMETDAQAGLIHGAGESRVDAKTQTAVFFEAIDDVFWKELLHRENVPMILAGVEYVLPIYKSVSDYKYIWPEYLTGNREQQPPNELYEDAMQIIRPYFEESKQKALDEYHNRSASSATSSLIADIIPAAYYSRVSVLFVRLGDHVWGNFNANDNILELAHTPDEGGEDLVDNAVTQTIANGGEVYLLSPEEMPANSQMAAIFRYSAT